MENQKSLFNVETAQSIVDRIKTEINCPFVSATISTLGGKDNVSILVAISLDPKENWTNNIFENSRYRRFDIYNNGKIKNFTSSKLSYIRKCTAKSVDDLLTRLNKAMTIF